MNISLPLHYLPVKRTQWYVDIPMLLPVLALISIGLIMIASASFSFAEYRYNNEFYFVTRHIAYMVVAAGAMGVGYFVSPTVWAQYGRLWMLLSIVLLILVLVPGIGREVNGARRWLNLGGFSLQVSELVKVATVVFLAAHLQKHRDTLAHNWREFAKLIGVITVLSVLLILEPDFGSVVVLGVTFMAMLFLGGTNLRQYVLVLLVAAALLYWVAEAAPYRVARLATFLDPWSVRFESGYQLTQSLIAFGRGEWFGVGLGQSVQKMMYLPEAHTDFVFAIYAEEFGFMGVVVLLGLYVQMVLRILQLGKIAIAKQYWYGLFILLGFGLLISCQTFINLGVNAGLLPTKGLTLPFVSYGGSSLVVCCAMVGMMLRISHELHTVTTKVRRLRYER
tara:strand:- start:7485 stop:8663 length:1179 start_codon:yes stop_codon:yes gene_type:complete